MNFETKPYNIDNLHAIIPSVVAVNINSISNDHDPVINRIYSNIMVVLIGLNLLSRIPEVIDSKVIDSDRVIDVYSVVHTNIDNTFNDDHYANDYVDYFQHDPNPLIHTSDCDAAPGGNNYDDLDSEHDIYLLRN